VAELGDPDGVDFMNHSRDSHLWFEDEVTLSARRPIDAEEEVTVDYALWAPKPSSSASAIRWCVAARSAGTIGEGPTSRPGTEATSSRT
jgi:hypothetical protein